MKIIVFAGGSTSPEETARYPMLVHRPPAVLGDVYSACAAGADTICLIDGFYDGRPRVSHSEILWAIANGVNVMGAAGLGALRAAELETFGMTGMGTIFRTCKASPVTREDHFAFTPAKTAAGWTRASEPYCNIAATLETAEKLNIIPATTRARLARIAQEMHFSERSFDRLVDICRTDEDDRGHIDRFQAWLPEGKCDLLQDDAIELLEFASTLAETDIRPATAGFEFIDTWRRKQTRDEVFALFDQD